MEANPSVAFGYPNPACDCDPIQGPIKAETHGKAKRKHDVKAILVSILTTSALLLSMQCSAMHGRSVRNATQSMYHAMARHDHSAHLFYLNIVTVATCVRM